MAVLIAPELLLLFRGDATPAELPGEDLPRPFAALLEQFAGLLAAWQGEEADRHAAEACRMAREELGAASPVLAELLYGRAMLRVAMDEPGTAIALLEEAEGIWLGAIAPDSPAAADVDFGLATLYRALGYANAAERHFRRCAEVASGLGGMGRRLLAASLLALAEIREELRDDAEAEALYGRVLETLGDFPGVASTRVLIALDKLIAFHLARQNYPAAHPLLLRALRVTHRDFPDGHPFLADRLDDLGRFYHAMDATTRADPLYERAQQIRRRAFGADTPLYTLSLGNLAELAAASGDYAQAFDLFNQMSAIENGLVGRTTLGRNERRQMAYTSLFYSNMCKHLSIVVKHATADTDAVIAAFDLVQRRKAAGIAALFGRAQCAAGQARCVRYERASRVDEDLERLTQLRWQIARKALAGPSRGESGWEHRRQLAEWQVERDELERLLGHMAPVPEREPEPDGTERLVSEEDMPDGAVLVEFVRFDVFRFDAVPAHGDARWAPARYLAFVFPSSITRDVELYDLGEAGPIERLIAEFRAEVATDPSGSHPRDMAVRREAPAGSDIVNGLEAGPALYDVLLRPLSQSIGPRRRLLLAPDGDLNCLPFEVLPIGQGRRLIEEYEVSYVAVGRDLRHFGHPARCRWPTACVG